MQVLKLTWVPTGQVFAQAKGFEEGVSAAATKALRAGKRSFVVQAGDDGDTFELWTDESPASRTKLVVALFGEKVHHLAGTGSKEPAIQRSELQSIRGKVPTSGWYKGQGRRHDLAADPRKGPYFLAFVDAEDRTCGHEAIEALVQEAAAKGAEYPLDVVLASLDLRAKLKFTSGEPTFVLVLRDDNPPKLRFNQKWGPNEGPRSMQVVYRRPL